MSGLVNQQKDDSQLSRLVSQFIQQERKEKAKHKPKYQPQQSNSHIQRSFKGKQFYDCIGMIKSLWRNKKTKEPEYMDYGTAFAVSQHLIMTCTHNIFHEQENIVADQIVFVPNHKGYIEPNTEKYYSMPGQYYRFISLKQGQTLKEVPTINELCLLTISKPIQAKRFIKIGLYKPNEDQSVQIIGFPSKKYARMNNLLSVNLTRQHLRDKFVSIKKDILSHQLETKIGHSGSPILYEGQNNQMVAIGIHTHRGDALSNRGLYFSKQVIELIKKFENKLTFRYGLKETIQYQKQNGSQDSNSSSQMVKNIFQVSKIKKQLLSSGNSSQQKSRSFQQVQPDENFQKLYNQMLSVYQYLNVSYYQQSDKNSKRQCAQKQQTIILKPINQQSMIQVIDIIKIYGYSILPLQDKQLKSIQKICCYQQDRAYNILEAVCVEFN